MKPPLVVVSNQFQTGLIQFTPVRTGLKQASDFDLWHLLLYRKEANIRWSCDYVLVYLLHLDP